ncbi:MAG: PDZ domain-containing protein [Ferruginibacter sp.]
MNRLIVTALCFVLFISIMPSTLLTAQDVRSQKIIIQRDGDGEKRITVEVIGDSVWVNGKAVDKDSLEGFSFRKRNMPLDNSDFFSLDMDGLLDGTPFSGSGQWGSKKIDSLAFLGVQTERDEAGAKITSVEPASAAEKAGLKEGDVITQVQDLPVTDPASLSKIIQAQKPGSVVEIKYIRKRKNKKADATLGVRVESNITRFSIDQDRENLFSFRMPDLFDHPENDPSAGFPFRNSTSKQKLGLTIRDTPDESGVTVLEVMDGSLAASNGLQKGDLIISIADEAVKNTDEARQALREANRKSEYIIRYQRKGQTIEATIRVPKQLKTTEL